MTRAAVSSGFTLEPQTAGRTLEFAAFGFPLGGAFVVGWPAAPGAVRYEADDQPALLHFAPARWLVPQPHPDIEALLQAAVDAGAGIVVDVEGKWQPLLLRGPGAKRVLATAVDIESALHERACAALTLFDCPSIVAACAGGYSLWVRASYAADFIAAVERLGA
ncbi:MAG: hypothetical protein JSR54_00650 [Proteobacteria bacterium]|nr:hypothetical protein [Pseudomonadota bacterium]